jgi:hypothetical protein
MLRYNIIQQKFYRVQVQIVFQPPQLELFCLVPLWQLVQTVAQLPFLDMRIMVRPNILN